MPICNYCKSEMPKGTGTLYIKKSGKFAYFCSSKCEKNAIILGRKPASKKWSSSLPKVKPA